MKSLNSVSWWAAAGQCRIYPQDMKEFESVGGIQEKAAGNQKKGTRGKKKKVEDCEV